MPTASARRRAAVVALAIVVALTGTVGPAPSPAGAGAPGPCDTSEARGFVCDSYASFFRREPTSGEVDYWAPLIPARKTFFLATLARASESRRRTIEAYYGYFGGVIPSAGDIAYWEGEVLKPNGLRRLEAALITTYQGIDYVDHAYELLLGREASDSEQLYWEGQVVLKGRNLVAAAIAYTFEARAIRVEYAFQNELDYFPDDASRDYWAERSRTGLGYLDLRISLKAAPDGYPEGTRYCSAPAPVIDFGCVT